MYSHTQLIDFIIESNRIEGIKRPPTQEEVDELIRFMGLDRITLNELKNFVSVYQPGAQLRDKPGLNVRVGSYIPPKGGPHIVEMVNSLLDRDLEAYDLHIKYEMIHPFTDGNGRSGRALWAWKMQDLSLGFLHKFYYQTLQRSEYELQQTRSILHE